MKKQMAELQNEVKELKDGIKKTTHSYADVIKMKNEAETIKGNLSKLEDKVENINFQEETTKNEQNIEPAIEETSCCLE